MKNKLLKSFAGPEQSLAAVFKKIPNYIRITFASSFVLGLLTHMYMLTNKLPNHDDIGHLFVADYGTASGRWLLPTVLRMDGTYSMPWLIGVLAIFFLALSACMIVSLLRIRRPVACIVTSAILVSFPTVASTFTYMFTSDAYFLALLLSVFGAYAAVRFRFGLALGAVCVALSMGIYQAYFVVAAVLVVGALIFDTLDGELHFKRLLLRGLKYAGTLALGMAAYLVMVRLTTRSVALVDYMGIAEMGKLELAELPAIIVRCYGQYASFFLKDSAGVHFRVLRYLFVLVGICAAVIFLALLWRRKLGALRTALAVFLAVLYPLAGNIIHIMVSGGGVHLLMLYGLSFILIAPIALVEYAGFDAGEQRPWKRSAYSAICWIVLLSMALTAYSYAVVDNKAYLKQEIGFKQSYAYSVRLLSAVEQCEGYSPDMPIVLVGSHLREDIGNPTPELDQVQMIGVFDMAAHRSSYTYGHLLKYFLGYSGAVHLGDSDIGLAYAGREELGNMPQYPADGSIRILDGMVIVKLN